MYALQIEVPGNVSKSPFAQLYVQELSIPSKRVDTHQEKLRVPSWSHTDMLTYTTRATDDEPIPDVVI